MVTQQLLDYIADQRARGFPDDQTKQALVSQGWQVSDVDAALSGTPSMASTTAVPPEIHGWNWGAAFLTWIWGIRFRVWISLLCFVPVVGGIWWIVLGIKGNEWAWRAGQWSSVEEFKKSQHAWAVAAIVLLVVSFGLGVLAAMFLMANSGGTTINTNFGITNL